MTSKTVSDISETISKKDDLSITENDIKIGKALSELIKDWEDLFAQMGSNKFNKSAAIMYLKETTRLSSKEVRESLKKFKNRYYEVKFYLLNN